MSTLMVGVVVGGVLGLLDGLSAWFYPEARPMMVAIVLGSTVKGVSTGVAAGFVARWRRSLALGVAAGVVVGFVLSTLAALGQPDHYWTIVLPGMLVGALTGIATQRVRSAVIAAVAVSALTMPGAAAGPQPSNDNRLLSGSGSSTSKGVVNQYVHDPQSADGRARGWKRVK